jgi:aspartate racemase
VYHEYFRKEDGFQLMEPGPAGQAKINDAIYNKDYGIKAHSQQIKPQAREPISHEIHRLIERGAEAVILGCTELPLAVCPRNFTAPMIDPGLLTARRLIALVAPEKLLTAVPE